MNELMNARGHEQDFRWCLLTTVSSLALLASMYGIQDASAEDSNRPTVWIELGGQLEQMSGGQEPLAPPFVANLPNTFFSPSNLQKPLLYSYGGEGAISFEPEGSDWIFSASVLYGRSNGVSRGHQQTPNAIVHGHLPILKSVFGISSNFTKYPSSHVKFSDATVKQNESHAVLDFQAGKDVGLGMFGNRGSSVISAGVRFAQFSSKTNVNMRAEPDVNYPAGPISSIPALQAFRSYDIIHFHDYAVIGTNQRSFRGVGPSLAWNASTPLIGNPDAGEMTIDWGANAAVLFGRQKASGHHQTTVGSYYRKGWGGVIFGVNGFGESNHSTQQTRHVADFNRVRSVVIPNLGGFASISYRFPDAKLSFGYRGDFFFGAMDGGLDTRHSVTAGFHGPYATISVGLGG